MTHYFELRPQILQPPATLGADIARHFEVRQYLGTAVVVCDTPHSLLSVVRKQWMHLARNLHKQRASTLNAEEILRITQTIMHMQHMQFVAKPPTELASAHVYFVTPEQFTVMPPTCFTLYITAFISPEHLERATTGMPDHGLVVNYDIGVSLSQLGLRPKRELEAEVLHRWQEFTTYLQKLGVNPQTLTSRNPTYIEAGDDALDTLLTVSNDFLRQANAFQHTIYLAQPLVTISAEQKKVFQAIARLAHRVQTLSPDNFSNYLVKHFGDNTRFFLRDPRVTDMAAPIISVCVA